MQAEFGREMNRPDQWVVLTPTLEALLRMIAKSPCQIIKTNCIILTIMNHISQIDVVGFTGKKPQLYLTPLLFYVRLPLGRLRT